MKEKLMSLLEEREDRDKFKFVTILPRKSRAVVTKKKKRLKSLQIFIKTKMWTFRQMSGMATAGNSFSAVLKYQNQRVQVCEVQLQLKLLVVPCRLGFQPFQHQHSRHLLLQHCLLPLLSTDAFILSVSAIFLRVRILLLFIPSIFGLIAFAPGDKTK